jgi:two-component system invasion response regulator UvrY
MIDPLTDRELQILAEAADVWLVKQTADRLGISKKTVETYRERIRDKLGTQTICQAVAMVIRQGLLKGDAT